MNLFMRQIIDLHIHSKYSRACSRDLELPKIAKTCETKGIDICATGDFTHPAWLAHIKENLKEENEGIYKLNPASQGCRASRTKFIIGTEIASIKKHKDKTRRLHLCIFAPDLKIAEKFNKVLEGRGFNLKSDGRPILGMTAKDILELMLEVDERMVMIPAHAWTPWFGIFGSKGGYDTLEECFEDLTPNIFAIETGLSSDPLMNWRLSVLDKIALVSNSDAHSLGKLGREANVLDFKNEKEITYDKLMRTVKEKNPKEFLHTIEFYPEEGKYHMDGHKDCHFFCEPEQSKKMNNICPKCKKKLVIGVMNRVMELSDRSVVEAKKAGRTPYKSLVPLDAVLADTLGVGANTKKVKTEYDNLIKKIGNEFFILLDSDIKDIAKASDKNIATAIKKAREGDICIKPGYDGEFGIVKIFKEGENKVGFKQVKIDL